VRGMAVCLSWTGTFLADRGPQTVGEAIELLRSAADRRDASADETARTVGDGPVSWARIEALHLRWAANIIESGDVVDDTWWAH
jgi:hypothetical protein